MLKTDFTPSILCNVGYMLSGLHDLASALFYNNYSIVTCLTCVHPTPVVTHKQYMCK